jgi:hypothetical protein
MTDVCRLLLFFVLVDLAISSSIHKRSYQSEERIDCYPDASSPFSGYSKEACLARSCLFDDTAPPGVFQCYLSPNYGYILKQSPQQTELGLRLRLQRNQAVGSMFPEPIENVILDVEYYTNEIIRFKLYDEDNQRYQVRLRKMNRNDVLSFLLGANSINSFTRSGVMASI